MSLNKLNKNSTAPAFEADDDVMDVVSNSDTPAQVPAVQQSTSTALAAPAQTASKFANVENTVAALKNAVRVDYDTLPSIIVSNGNFFERASKKNLGDNLTFELLSWQDSYVVQPGDDKAPKETVRYSNDGVVCSDGTLVSEHLQSLREAGYERASVKERAVVVGSLISASKDQSLIDELVQFDLSPKSRAKFQNYQLKAMNAQRLGKATAEQVTKVRATTAQASSGNNIYTLAEFAIA
jgi:hypothetical protein